ncbi:MAG: hypothetical protein WA628_18315 [Terriglobales bacterium]
MKKLLLLTVILAATAASAQFTYTSLDFPGATLTTARGINSRGDIVGSCRLTPPRHAMLLRGGRFLPLAPSTLLGTDFSEAYKTNDRGDVVGSYAGDDNLFHGFVLHKGVVTTLDFPGATQTYAFGINESGAVVGEWDVLDAQGNLLAYHGYTWKDGTFSEVNFPGSADTALIGINAEGDYVGIWDSDITSPNGHGFVCSKQTCASFDVPGATLTQADDINDRGQIVGAFIDTNSAAHGFLKVRDSFTVLDYPGAVTTVPWGINSRGDIVGNHFDSVAAAPRGFLARRTAE